MRAKNFLAAAVLAGIAFTAPDAAAFCRKTTCKLESGNCQVDEAGCSQTGNPLRWRKLPIPFRFSIERPSSLIREDARAAIRDAFHRWSDTLCGPDGAQRRTSLRFVEGEDVVTDKPLEPGVQAAESYGIFFRDRGWPYENKQDSTLAQTNTFFGKTSGLIEYSDMEINTGKNRFSTKEGDEGDIDLQAVITHEVGHYIGLDHSLVPQSIMVASYCDSTVGRCAKGKVAARRLSNDDIAAVCFMYPPEGYQEEPASSQAVGCQASGRSGEPFVLAALGGVAIVALRRRKKK